MEETFFILKPDAVKRGLVGEVIHRIERRGFQITRLERRQIDLPTLEKHYADLVDKPFFPSIAEFMMSGPVIIGTLEGSGAIQAWRDMLGATDPAKAHGGTIRGDFALGAEPGAAIQNIAHGSDSKESAQREIDIWFN